MLPKPEYPPLDMALGGATLPETLKDHLEALAAAEAQGVPPLNFQYVLLQFSLANVYYNMNNLEGAQDVYMKISKTLSDALRNDRLSAEERPNCILHALLADTGLADVTLCLDQENIPLLSGLAKNLAEMINRAQAEIAARSPETADLLAAAEVGFDVDLERIAAETPKAVSLARSMRASGDFDMWQPYGNDLIRARDKLYDLCIAMGKHDRALLVKSATWWIDLASGCGPEKKLVRSFELASWKHNKADFDGVVADLIEQGEVGVEFIPGVSSVEEARSKVASLLEESKQGFEKTLEAIAAADPEMRRNKDVVKARALATYELGSIALLMGELDKARDLIREARAQAKASGHNYLVDAADAKLAKVGKGDKKK